MLCKQDFLKIILTFHCTSCIFDQVKKKKTRADPLTWTNQADQVKLSAER